MAASLTQNVTSEFGVGGTAPVAAVTVTSSGGDAITMQAATSGGDTFLNDGRTLLIVRNKTADTVNMTLTGVGVDNYGAVDNVTISSMAGSTTPYEWWVFGPFSTQHFNDSDNLVKVAFTGYANVDLAAVTYGPVLEK